MLYVCVTTHRVGGGSWGIGETKDKAYIEAILASRWPAERCEFYTAPVDDPMYVRVSVHDGRPSYLDGTAWMPAKRVEEE